MMRRSVLLAFSFVAALFPSLGCSQTPKVSAIEIVNSGMMAVEKTDAQRKAPGTLTGSEKDTSGVHVAVKAQTDVIPAILGTSFGVIFKVVGEPEGAPVKYTAKLIHPPITNERTNTTMTEETSERVATLGKPSNDGFTFENKWELVPGKWTFQYLVEGKVLAEKSFEVARP
jgi:hypothetical protein